MTDDAIYDLLWQLASIRPAQTDLLALQPEALSRLLAIARIHGVLGLVLSRGGNVDTGAGEVWQRVHRAWKGQVIHSVRIREHARMLLQQLEEAGIRAVQIKGPDFADHLYENPRLRPTLDVDLLVPREDWNKAIQVLLKIGHR